jgi:hypothetical protein
VNESAELKEILREDPVVIQELCPIVYGSVGEGSIPNELILPTCNVRAKLGYVGVFYQFLERVSSYDRKTLLRRT